MDNDPENKSRTSPTRRVSKRMKLAALRRTSATTASTQPADNLTPTTSNPASGPSNVDSTAGEASATRPTMSATAILATSSVASSPSGTLNAPTVASTAQASSTTSLPLPMVSLTISDDLESRAGTSTLKKRFALPGEKIPKLTKNPTRAQVMSITNTLLMLDCPFTFVDVISEVETLLQTRHWMNRVARESCLQWCTWTFNQFVYELRQAFPDSAVAQPHSSESYYDFELYDLTSLSNYLYNSYELSLDGSLQAICAQFPDVTKEEDLKAANLLISRLPEQPVYYRTMCFRPFNSVKPVIETVEDFRSVWKAQLESIRDQAQDVRDVGWILQGTDQTKHLVDKLIRKRSSATISDPPLTQKSSKLVDNPLCTGCGRSNHTVDSCHFKSSPYYNATDKAYTASASYVELRRAYPTMTLAPSAKYLVEKGKSQPTTSTPSAFFQPKKLKTKGALIPDSVHFTTITSPEFNTDYLSVAVSQSLEPPKNVIKALLDTGSLAGDFIAYRYVLNLKLESFILSSKKRQVFSGLDNQCYDISSSINLRTFK
jgi:hypothetical protein